MKSVIVQVPNPNKQARVRKYRKDYSPEVVPEVSEVRAPKTPVASISTQTEEEEQDITVTVQPKQKRQKCFKCGQWNHKKSDCPNLSKKQWKKQNQQTTSTNLTVWSRLGEQEKGHEETGDESFEDALDNLEVEDALDLYTTGEGLEDEEM